MPTTRFILRITVILCFLMAVLTGICWFVSKSEDARHEWMIKSRTKEVVLLEQRQGKARIAINLISPNPKTPWHYKNPGRIFGPYRYS